jgi:ribosomal protein L37AE/L43A
MFPRRDGPTYNRQGIRDGEQEETEEQRFPTILLRENNHVHGGHYQIWGTFTTSRVGRRELEDLTTLLRNKVTAKFHAYFIRYSIKLLPFVSYQTTGRLITYRREIKIHQLTYEVYNELLLLYLADYEVSQDTAQQIMARLEFGVKVRLVPRSSSGSGGMKVRNEIPVHIHPKKMAIGLDLRTLKSPEGYCAAIALMSQMIPNSVKVGKRWSGSQGYRTLLEKAKELSLELGWSDEVEINQFNRFILHHPKKAVLVLKPYMKKILNHNVFEGSQYDRRKENQIYLLHDSKMGHFYGLLDPERYLNGQNDRRSLNWCYDCYEAFEGTHDCILTNQVKEPLKKKRKTRSNQICPDCHESYKFRHRCGHWYCNFCDEFLSGSFQSEHFYHRHEIKKKIVMLDMAAFLHEDFVWKPSNVEILEEDGTEEDEEFLRDDIGRDQLEFPKSPSRKRLSPIDVWAFDIESMFVRSEETYEYKKGVEYMKEHFVTHRPNLVICKNVFSDEELIFHDMKSFLEYFMSNGNTILFSHNGSGYDTRLVFEEATNINNIKPDGIILKGTKILALRYGKLIFKDSLRHLQSSLKRLAKDFGLKSGKGFFPYLFNTFENQDYVGTIPDLKYFHPETLTKEDYEELKLWHSKFHQEKKVWDFKKEILKYCQQDVRLLCQILKIYNKIHREISGLSPFMKSTSAGVSQRVFLKIYLEPGLWTSLRINEYYFVRKCLRGGRTEIRIPYVRLTDEQLKQGWRIRYWDVVSMYPYVQMVRDYPKGSPKVHVYDPIYHPKDDRIQILEHSEQPSLEFLKSFFGFICCDIDEIPKDLYHPVLVSFDKEKNKMMADLKPKREQYYVSFELQKALEMGYKVGKVYRIDEYQRSKSPWKNFMRDHIKLKIENSSPPKEMELKDYCEIYLQRFGIQLNSENIQERPAAKMIYKILINSNWGKNAESPDHGETLFFNNTKLNQMRRFLNLEEKNGLDHTMTTPRLISDNILHVRKKIIWSDDPKNLREPDLLTEGYLPAACMVPAYGRMLLWEFMMKVPYNRYPGDLVLFHDTDSCCFLTPPGWKELDHGPFLGDFEPDKIEKKGLLYEFMGLGPKSYALSFKKEDGTLGHVMKCKGIRNNLMTQENFTLDQFRDLVLKKLNHVLVPDQKFQWSYLDGEMKTRKMVKKIVYVNNKGIVKKNLDDGLERIYPFGHQETLELDEVEEDGELEQVDESMLLDK